MCLAGDFNVMLSVRSYPIRESRNTLNDLFKTYDLECLTKDLDINVNHVELSKKSIENRELTLEFWNIDKSLSDHIGICISVN